METGTVARRSNFELLRILCMLSILSLHFLTQSNVKQFANCSNMYYIVLQSYGRIACTIFFMISAWFLSDSKFSLRRVIRVESTAIFYGIVFWLMARILHIDCADVTLISAMTPTISGNLWFVMIYIQLLFLSPIINVAFDIIDIKKTRQIVFIPLGAMLLYSTILMNEGRFIKDITFFPLINTFPIIRTIEKVRFYNKFICSAKKRPSIFVKKFGFKPFQMAYMAYSG